LDNPISTFSSVRDFYISYLETAFRISHPEIQAMRRALLEQVETLSTDAYLEPMQKYADCGISVSSLRNNEEGEKWLPGFSPDKRNAFIDLCLSGLLPRSKNDPTQGRFNLYTHQLQMLRRGVQTGQPGIVTSGTGSGKTESFLLPVLAQIAKEASNWPRSPAMASWQPWWRDGEAAEPFYMRDTEATERPKAVRAIILYPMNALVEDQLVRMRRALDSDEAHREMDRHFGGNRIFFGRYTSATPVTGWPKHPRLRDAKEKRRAARKAGELHAALNKLDETYAAALEQDDESLRFNFPRMPGAEMVSRWDMQRHPPDILITNTSMLSTMLVREIEEPIFDQTRSWIESDPNAYFYLVMDELHLQRGTAGTEVCYLLRNLLHRLGLDKECNRHKLRILASSASLPMKGELREQSLEYLWGMFDENGLPSGAGRNAWAESVVEGDVEMPPALHFTGHLVQLCATVKELERDPLSDNSLWRQAAAELGGNAEIADTEEAAYIAVAAAAQLLHAGCLSPENELRATSIPEVAERLFGQDELARDGVNALIWLRGAADRWKNLFGHPLNDDAAGALPRFRVHAFLRALEGLFVAPIPAPQHLPREQRALRLFSDLTVESGERYGVQQEGKKKPRRVDMLYCECCGTLFFGGRRSVSDTLPGRTEILPNDPDTDTLPERAKATIVEQRSAEDYSVFMPTMERFWPLGREEPSIEEAFGRWSPAVYDPFTATIQTFTEGRELTDSCIAGFHYQVNVADFKDKTVRGQSSPQSPGTALPFQCPACGTSYRRGKGKLSPIRGFRVGFAKTTQLLASSLMGELHKSNPMERLVAFSDSRQDAAKAAFDLEGGHHDDARREIIVRLLTQMAEQQLTEEGIQKRLAEIRVRRKELEQKEEKGTITPEELNEDDQLHNERMALQSQRGAVSTGTVRLGDLLEPEKPKAGEVVRPLLSELVSKGIHPTDRTGITPVPDPASLPTGGLAFAWQQLFSPAGAPEKWMWREGAAYETEMQLARAEITEELRRLVGLTVFSKTYFALEEAGWGYPCIPGASSGSLSEADIDAMLRVLGDSNRLIPQQFEGNDTPWTSSRDVTGRLRKFVKARCEKIGGEPATVLDSLLSSLQVAGHQGGLAQVQKLHFRPVEVESPYWRCDNCGRVHLHRGAGICTRCYELLPENATGQAGELRKANFLGKQIQQSAGIRRMRCEELTGMTVNPAARLRRFKGILIADDDDILPSGVPGFEPDEELDRKSRVVDLLSVTTTMEVGVDIGDLRAVFQANMPPQRFNYQQRVGRAGRRGQAFSFVLTVCRSKSHDLHYFRHPNEITGDPPPPPFLTLSLEMIAQRMVRKVWFVAAFRLLRQSKTAAGVIWPADRLSPPDNHGEFFNVAWLNTNRTEWLSEIKQYLDKSSNERDMFALTCAAGDRTKQQAILAPLTVNDAMASIEAVLADSAMQGKGLAEAFAELGMFPMYGMPTRTRQLATRPLKNRDGDIEFSTMDRDLDVAIQEFAPGKYLIQDKRRYFTAGFSGQLTAKPGKSTEFESRTHDLGEPHSLVKCRICEAWGSFTEETTNCPGCGTSLAEAERHKCFVPRGFITSLVSKNVDDDAEQSLSAASKSSMAEAVVVEGESERGTNALLQFNAQTRCYRLNRGEHIDGSWSGFNADRGRLSVPLRANGQALKISANGLWIERAAAAADVGNKGSQISQRFISSSVTEEAFYLAAPKVTDSLIIAAQHIPNGLQLTRISSSDQPTVLLTGGARAAIISAAFLLVNYVSRTILDIDPEELEVIEPRIQRLQNGRDIPVLQIADRLVNGSGLCDRLRQPGLSGETIIVEAMRVLLREGPGSPLSEMLAPSHSQRCAQACYRCLHRYGNQAYHGLLDWRLGLDAIALLLDSSYLAGLDGNFTSPGLQDWSELSLQLANEAGLLFRTEVKLADNVPIFEVIEGTWGVVTHPFWHPEAVVQANPTLQDLKAAGATLQMINTFDLTRRMGSSVARMRAQASLGI
jgi:DEAD/DEAH box helicase domain-containing protein